MVYRELVTSVGLALALCAGCEDSSDVSGDGGTGSGTTGTSDPGDDGGSVCQRDDDCVLVNDCCTCDAFGPNEDPPDCSDINCFAPTCAPYGITEAECRYGHCRVVERSCDPDLVTCDAPPPDCDADFVAVLGDDGCWAGCVPARFCDVVPSCDRCAPGEMCVITYRRSGDKHRCEPIPPGCDGSPDCECVPDACNEDHLICSEEEGDRLGCNCPDC